MASEDSNEPQTHREHHGDTLATKLFDRTNGLGKKTRQKTPGLAGEKKGPAGGFEDTPVPKATPGYTLRFTFHRATSLPMADLNSLSSDPYVLAQLNTSLSKRHKQDPNLRFRTPTIRRSTDPEWNSVWIVANVPASGFKLKARIYDEDPADHDDRLGNVHVNVDHINEDWEGIREQAYKIRKRMGSKRAYAIRGCAAMFNRRVPISGDLIVSVQVLGRSQAEYGGRMYTIGPCDWTQHLSPLIGRLTGTKDPRDDNDENKTEKYKCVSSFLSLRETHPNTGIVSKRIKYSLLAQYQSPYIIATLSSSHSSPACSPRIPYVGGSSIVLCTINTLVYIIMTAPRCTDRFLPLQRTSPFNFSKWFITIKVGEYSHIFSPSMAFGASQKQAKSLV